MAFAIVFSGQGMQHAAMLPWLAEDRLVEQTRHQLGSDDWRAGLADARWAAGNANAQRLLTGLNLAAWAQLSAALPAPAAVAGYSVGELASFSAAGVFDAGTALTLAGLRVQAMDRCAERAPGGLLAVTGLAPAQIERLCAETACSVAIDNGSHAVVLGGTQAALQAAERAAAAAGARSSRLKVDVASHTPSMISAADDFAALLSEHALRGPRLPLFSGSGEPIRSAAQAGRALACQIAQTVRWSACMDQIHMRRPRCLLEIGPGAALARMWNERFPDVPARSADEFHRATAIIDWVLRHAED